MRLLPIPTDPHWGRPYGGSAFLMPDGLVWMFRKGQRVRFYDVHADQLGPEQANVAPAMAYAHSQGWVSL